MAEPDFYERCSKDYYRCQNGIQVHLPSNADRCGAGGRARTQVCIRYYGDYVYVYDGYKDGDSAIGTVLVRGGEAKVCRNRLGYGKWARCNFNWVESRTKDVYAGFRYGYEDIIHSWQWTFSGR
jgi:hypothetical protein